MNELAGGWPGTLVSTGPSLEGEFEARLRDSSGLAFNIAYGVLRNREDAEEVAQEAFARAFRRFAQLKDRARFRAWLTRTTWRLAIDRLPEKLRVVIVLAAIEGHDTREVARLLELPEGTVKSRMFLARKALAKTLRWLTTSDSPAR